MNRMMTSLLCGLMLVGAALTGCGNESGSTEAGHSHDLPAHMPRSLGHLCQQMRVRLEKLEHEENSSVQSELADLVSWTPEFAGDTEISERRWIPIYELSEQIRLSIVEAPTDWGTQRQDQIMRLCQISEDAWRAISPDQRGDRYQGHHHHDAHDHKHKDHEHGDHEHGLDQPEELDHVEASPIKGAES